MPTTGERTSAIETHYAGCRFRSRLEARWAVFFDRMSIGWEYEPQGYRVGGFPYLPDFWLPKLRQWVEVKGSVLNQRERTILAAAVRDLPNGENGVLLLGPIPDLRVTGASAWHSRYTVHDGELYVTPYAWDGDEHRPEWLVAKPVSKIWNPAAVLYDPYLSGGRRKSTPVQRRIVKAYVAARSARFEHGERG